MRTTSFLFGVTFAQRTGGDELSPEAIAAVIREAINGLSNRGQMVEATQLSFGEETLIEVESNGVVVVPLEKVLAGGDVVDVFDVEEALAPTRPAEALREMGRVIPYPGRHITETQIHQSETPILDRLVARSGL